MVNLYPFAETVASGASADECVEQIDIGGPVDGARGREEPPSRSPSSSTPTRYAWVLDAVRAGGFSLDERKRVRREGVPAHRGLRRGRGLLDAQRAVPADEDGSRVPGLGRRHAGSASAVLRYGENPHQAAALYVDRTPRRASRRREQLHGKEMSYNNYIDADAAWRAAYDHAEPAVAIIKHANPCGIAIGAATSRRRTARPTPATRSPRSAASSRPTAR